MFWFRLLILSTLFTLPICQSYSTVYAQAQDGFAKHHQEIAGKNPAGLNFTLKLKNGQTEFRTGEKVRLELSFATSVPDAYVYENANYDRSGRLEIDTFVVDQTSAVNDPLFDYFHGSRWHGMGGLRGIDTLSPDKPQSVNYDLNEWLRFDKPGKYRLYVISHRLTKGKPHHEGNLAVEPVSNIVEFQIVPSTPDWQQATLATALKTLNEPNRPNSSVGESERRSACRVLRFLGSESSIKEMAARLRGEDQQCDYEYYLGLIGAANRRLAREQMEAALDRPTQPVSSSFLNALVQIASAERMLGDGQQFANDEAGQKAAQAQWERWRSNYDLTVQAYVDRLAGALARKERTAAAISIQTLLSYGRNDQSTGAAERKKSLVHSLTRVFLDLPPESQRNMLEYNWPQLSEPSMLPVLRQLYEHPPDLHESPQPFPGIALRRIYELAPAEGRQLILEEMRRPKLRVGFSVFRLLPDKELPELEDTIVARAIEQGDATSTALIPRYVSAASLPRLRTAFENQIGRLACLQQGHLISYFLRVDPDFGLEMVRKAVDSRRETHCYSSVLNGAVREALLPEFEKLALDYLDDSDPEVVLSAEQILSKSGSAANKAKIKAAITRVINAWREARVDPEAMQGESAYFPGYFAQSLLRVYATAIPWVTAPEEFQELADLCLTAQCRQQLKPRDLLANKSIRFFYSELEQVPGNFAVGEYETLSLPLLKKKLIQFPKGTKFTWASGNAPKEIDERMFAEVETYLKEQGYELGRNTGAQR
jgi:hypothetical protein